MAAPEDGGPGKAIAGADADAADDIRLESAGAGSATLLLSPEIEEAPFIAVDDGAEDEPPAGALPEAATAESFSILDDRLPEEGSEIAPTGFQTRRGPAVSRSEDEEDLRRAASRMHLMTTDPMPDLPLPKVIEGAVSITAPALDIPGPIVDDDEAGDGPTRKRRTPPLGRVILKTIPDAAHGTMAQQKMRRAETGRHPLAAPPPVAAPTPERSKVKGQARPTPRRQGKRSRTLIYLIALLLLAMVGTAIAALFFGQDRQAALPDTTASPTTSEAAAPEEDVIPPSDGAETEPPAPSEAIRQDSSGTTQDQTASGETSATDAAVESALNSGDAISEPTVAPPAEVPATAPAPTPEPAADAAGAPAISDTAPAPGDVAGPAGLPDARDSGADTPPLPQPLPPPFGTVVTFGPGGLIVPTPEGVITPDGFTLFAGQPPVVPPARPGSAAPAPAAPTAPATATDPAVDPAVDPAAERPDDGAALTPQDDPQTTVGDAVPADPAVAGRRPKNRPESVIAAAIAAHQKADALAEAAADAAKAEAERLASATPQAVASSRRPASRPSGFSKAVEAAVAAAVATPPAVPEPAAAPEPAAVPAPAASTAQAQEIDEPEPVAATPNMPTSVTVSKQATVKNALNLGEVSLIGVFGSSANRRALIRMPTGRFIKVKVGDRLDGGTVAAIGDSEVSYVKRGRTIVLKMTKKG